MAYTQEELTTHRSQWVEALRSGDYEQTSGQLRNDVYFCCLGVLCEISGLVEWADRNIGKMFAVTNQDVKGDASVLPREVMDWVGLRTVNGSITDHIALSVYNDQGMPFLQIADIIENEPDGLFE